MRIDEGWLATLPCAMKQVYCNLCDPRHRDITIRSCHQRGVVLDVKTKEIGQISISVGLLHIGIEQNAPVAINMLFHGDVADMLLEVIVFIKMFREKILGLLTNNL